MRLYRHALAIALALGSLLSMRTLGTASERVPWDMKKLSAAPKFSEDPTRSKDGVKAIFYDGLPWKGMPTRVFAYYAIPDAAPGVRVPAMVLVHGGGGTAFMPWVKLWLSRGYAAIAMDTCGSIGSGGYVVPVRDDQGGPPGWGGFNQIDEAISDQWAFHAVADVILANSLLRTFPEIDPDKIGITGISWGGYLTCIVAGVDRRFRFAAPVYGCGFLGEDSAWKTQLQGLRKDRSEKWLALWDPSVYLPNARMPILWVDGTNDFAYPPDSLQKSYRLPKSKRTVCMRVRMAHGHGGAGENPEEIHSMADAILRGAAPLLRITDVVENGQAVTVHFESHSPVRHAELNYTVDTGEWQKRTWQTQPAELDTSGKSVSAALPSGVTVWYINIIDDRGLVVSSEHVERSK